MSSVLDVSTALGSLVDCRIITFVKVALVEVVWLWNVHVEQASDLPTDVSDYDSHSFDKLRAILLELDVRCDGLRIN